MPRNTDGRMPPEFYESIASADDDALIQRRASVKEALEFVSGRSEAFLEAATAIDEINLEIVWRRATGSRGRPRRQAA